MLARRSEHTSGHRSGHTSGHRSRNCGFLDRVECAEPTNPTDGTVLYSQRGFESKATYSCHSGFELLGDDTRTCLSDETWSGATPTCVFTGKSLSVCKSYNKT